MFFNTSIFPSRGLAPWATNGAARLGLLAAATVAILGNFSPCKLYAQTSGTMAAETNFQEQRIYRRAVESVIWSQPLVATGQTLAAIRSVGGDFNTVNYTSRPPNWKYRVLTPNDTSLYVPIMTNTAIDGPMVIELPSSKGGAIFAGSVLDSFQDPLNDIGLGGDDIGEGGKYLLFPAGDTSPAPEGFIPVRSERHIAWSMFRVIPKSFSDADLNAAVDEILNIRVYPYAQADNPPETVFVDIFDKMFDTVLPLGSSYFDAMANMLDQETVTDLDKAFLGMMQTIGYQRGQPFDPSPETRDIIDRAARDAAAELMIEVANIGPVLWPSANWTLLAREPAVSTGYSFITDDLIDYDLRGSLYSYVCCGGVKITKSTNVYVKASRDGDGNLLDGGKTYKVTVPADAPTEQFWSFMAYDALNAVVYPDQPRIGLSSKVETLKVNNDGSVDVYFGPSAPDGWETNWIPTVEDTSLIVLFRLYGSTPRARDGSWAITDMVLIE